MGNKIIGTAKAVATTLPIRMRLVGTSIWADGVLDSNGNYVCTLEGIPAGDYGPGTIQYQLKGSLPDVSAYNSNIITVLNGAGSPPPVNQKPAVSFGPATSSTPTVGVAKQYTALATDADGTVSLVELVQVAGAADLRVVAVLVSDSTAAYVLNWTPPTAGTFYLAARATDNSGESAFSSVLTVVVQEAGTPTGGDTPPSGGTPPSGAVAAAPANSNTNVAARWLSADLVSGYPAETDYASSSVAITGPGSFVHRGKIYLRAPEGATSIGALQIGVRADSATNRPAGLLATNNVGFPAGRAQTLDYFKSGDSIQAGAGASSEATSCPGVCRDFLLTPGSMFRRVINEGHGGQGIYDLYNYLDPYVNSFIKNSTAQVILWELQWGHNNIDWNNPTADPAYLDDAKAKYVYCAKALAADPRVRLMVRTITRKGDDQAPGANPNLAALNFNQWLRDNQKLIGYWKLTDTALNDKVGYYKPENEEYWAPDHQHYSDAGYREMALMDIASAEEVRAMTANPNVEQVQAFPLAYNDAAIQLIGSGWVNNGSSWTSSQVGDRWRIIITGGQKTTIAPGSVFTSNNIALSVDGNPVTPQLTDFAAGKTFSEEHYTDGKSHIFEGKLYSSGTIQIVDATFTLYATAGSPPLGAAEQVDPSSLAPYTADGNGGWNFQGGIGLYTGSNQIGNSVEIDYERGITYIIDTNGALAGGTCKAYIDNVLVKTAVMVSGQLFIQDYPIDGRPHKLRLECAGGPNFMGINLGNITRY